MNDGGTCELCLEHYDDGDGKECPGCERKLCYLHFPMVGDPDWTPDVKCSDCRKVK